MKIETERLILRHWRDEDLAPFAAICADAAVMRYFPATYGREKSDGLARAMNAKLAAGGLGLLAAELRQTGAFIGFIGLNYPLFDHPIASKPEIGWRLAKEMWGQGLAPEAAAACLGFGFNTLKLQEIVSYTVEENLPSQRVMAKIGMKRDPAQDYDHPDIAKGHPFRRHLVWSIIAEQYRQVR